MYDVNNCKLQCGSSRRSQYSVRSTKATCDCATSTFTTVDLLPVLLFYPFIRVSRSPTSEGFQL